jgi:hypothetical protein
VDLLLKAGADVNSTDVEGQSAGHTLPAKDLDGDKEAIWRALLTHGLDIHRQCWYFGYSNKFSVWDLAKYEASQGNDGLLDLISEVRPVSMTMRRSRRSRLSKIRRG